MTIEQERLRDEREKSVPWKRWGPYLSERQWGTVREDYSDHGNAWADFTHDHATFRAYRWGEDGIAGLCDDSQRLCFALAFWNGKDPILKERLFGLTNGEGNHGEDVKEYYYYLDSTPTHSYMKFLYKYPQAAFPYDDLVATNAARGFHDHEYELIDTGIFAEDRYFDLFVEYAKAAPDDILIRITAHNRGPDPAPLHVLPTLWFHDVWTRSPDAVRPALRRTGDSPAAIAATDPILGEYLLHAEAADSLAFTENETNTERLAGTPNRTPYVKDAFHQLVVHGHADAVNPARTGTKAAALYAAAIPAGGSRVIRLRFSAATTRFADERGHFGPDFDAVFAARERDADDYYAAIIPPTTGEDGANVMRQALAGMLWTKQFYHFDVDTWLQERGCDPYSPGGKRAPRNEHWHHMHNADIISMPDKWEYPWYAAWDLAFHVLPLAIVDEGFAKDQLKLMLRERYMHPNGQIPAYEWNFGDVNPPVHAWATIFTYRLEKARTGRGDIGWLKSCFQKLLLNFTWWVNRKDLSGRNVFEGGFLGLDNIGVFDRSRPLPTGGYLEQADGTAWMALFCQNMLEMAVELSAEDPAYGELALKFGEHFLWIGSAMAHLGNDTGMWDEEDGFFYDVLRLPDGQARRLKVRSMVGLLPLCAATVFEAEDIDRTPELGERLRWFQRTRPTLYSAIHDPTIPGVAGRRLGSVLDEPKLRRVLGRLLDEGEFLSEFGIRSLSRYHADHPYVDRAGHDEYRVAYLPAESDNGMFGGNSNWRGPIWFPVNALIVRALLQYYLYYGDDFRVECPTGSGNLKTLYQVAEEISARLARIFLKDENDRRPVFGGAATFQEDPHWRDYILFYEFFHGDNGAGLGASHQTGWTGIVARSLSMFASLTPEQVLREGKLAYLGEGLKGD
ncbi:MGH1-like glycoside hydrolase domain-containing protein [Aquisphaera insulae]|uniref:MGH1-like glycoside hydrolase domain-containing protein n=1 Tax=Aquisphaera insulae TaxID=2712864 RepID=UPI0013ED1406|nr:glucosidase [Aquisphaera insulae]